jgi:hypothetical protein
MLVAIPFIGAVVIAILNILYTGRLEKEVNSQIAAFNIIRLKDKKYYEKLISEDRTYIRRLQIQVGRLKAENKNK